jgi:peptide/nickel transport system permease protein
VHLQTYILRRVLLLIPMLAGITVVSFVLSHAVPADPVTANVGEQAAADPAVVAAFRHRWGLDKPLYQQYLIYLWNLTHGDMGTSISTKQPVLLDLRQHLPATIELAIPAMAVGIAVGVPLGIVSAVNRAKAIDEVARVASMAGVSLPVFWLGLMAMLVFYAQLGIAPSPGRLTAAIVPPRFMTGFLLVDALVARRFDVIGDWSGHLVLPAIVLSLYGLSRITRVMRGSMLETLDEDFIRTARAKGLRRWHVIFRHAARNGLIPVVTIIGLSFGDLLSGAVVTETVFAWPGLGLYAFSSATSLDFPAIMGVGITVATVYIFVNLLVDIAYALFDPRVRVG